MPQTPFTSRVYKIASQIPQGKVMTYGQIALLLGNKNASRAVGMCMSRNTDTKAVPCHRVVASNGKLTGYAFGGVGAKKKLLLKEGVVFLSNTDIVDLQKSLWKKDS